MRGLHFQRPPHTQAKLVRCVRGAVLDVAVDLRKGSPTYGKHVAVELTEDNHRQLFIPKGFAHGFLVVSDYAEFCYKVTDFWHQGDEGGLRWNDPDIGIEWPDVVGDKFSDGTPLNINDRDRNYPGIKDAFKF
jgi:dTDP-4-dehydrorhamnose 3,5-epimerase